MKKKILSLMLGLTLVMSMTACGGSDAGTSGSSSAPVTNNADTSAQQPAAEPAAVAESTAADKDESADAGELVSQEANGLQIALPSDFAEADGGVDGLTVFTNADKTAFVTVNGPFVDDTADPDQFTEEFLVSAFEAGGYSDVTVDNIGTVQQPDGATAVTAFGTAFTGGEGQDNIVKQYYFMADDSGVYYIIDYIYPLEDTATDDVIADILASVTATGANASAEAGEDAGDEFSLWDAAEYEVPDLSDTTWNLCGGYVDGREMTEEELADLLEAYGGTCQFVFDADGGAQLVQGAGGLDGTYEYLDETSIGIALDANGSELRYGCIFADMDGLTMIAISDSDGKDGLFFAQ